MNNKYKPPLDIINNIMYCLKEYIFKGIKKYKKKSIKYILKFYKKNNIMISKESIDLFFLSIPILRVMLYEDLSTYLRKDPSINSIHEVIMFSTSFNAITKYRIANYLEKNNFPLLPYAIQETSKSISGIDINIKAEIGPYFFIDHGVGVVIGETTIIGMNVSIYQGVTLGTLNVFTKTKRHPTIMDNVTIFANATILGGNTVIHENCIIGANSFIIKSIAKDKIVRNKMA